MAGSGAKMWEETITLPTYKVAPPDPSPRFYSGRTYQGAKATFYPYPVSDQMTETKVDQQYKAVYLENDYIQFSVLPEIGGRIFTAMDKGNNYDFFYRQHVIKPALIGMLGAWISGGVEWNIPHHHRASSFMPVDYRMEENPDGSKTLWVGETELRHRMKWMVGMTLRPDHSYIEMTVKLFNRTPEAQSFLFWINPAVHVNPTYQVIFPPSTDWAVQHAKPEFASWPVAHQRYSGNDYTSGVDISWWKNNPSPVSFFAWDCQEDFFGGYDHGKEAGVAQISNHHVSPGKKFFEWGNGSEGEMWSKILSDNDGPYLELMAGSYSDNQPDYSWCQPGEVKVFKHYWYPIQKLGGIKNANIEAAVNLDITNQSARVAFNTTAAHDKARVMLKSGDRVILNDVIRISPKEPYVANVPLPTGVEAETVNAVLFDEKGIELVAYQPVKKVASPMPKPVKRPAAPSEITSNEELYLTGLRIEQLYSPSYDPVPYYKEAIRRDPGDYRANTALGSLLCRQGRFAEAEPFLRTAVGRATENYIRSKDGEAQYYLGVALRAQGKLDEARESFYRAIWSSAWQAAGYEALAELACAKGNYREALELVDRSIAVGAMNSKALELKTSLLRKLQRYPEAVQLANDMRRIDPLNARALHEISLIALAKHQNTRKSLEQMSAALRGQVNAWLELAIDYSNAGLFEDGARVLETFVAQAPNAKRIYPLVYYYQAYFQERLGHHDRALEKLALASQMPPDFCFPFQFEAEPILCWAIEQNPRDARAPYYLGNLLYDNQPLRAIGYWEKSVGIDPQFALAQRNLGVGRAQAQKDLPGAISCMEKAIALDATNPRFYYELDVLYESSGTSLQKRLDLMNARSDVVDKRDDVATRRVMLLTAAGRSEEALRILQERHFHNWEGSGSLHGVYVNACALAGLGQFKAGKPEDAVKDFRAALEYPLNQEVGKPRGEENVALIYYLIGIAQQALNQSGEASFQKSASAGDNRPSETQFFKALSLQKLGKDDEAVKIFEGLKEHGKAELTRETETVDYFAKFGEKRAERLRLADAHYLTGLGQLGQGNKSEAQQEFREALKQHPAHLGALSMQEWAK